MPENAFYVKLKDRGLIHLVGPDRHDFLQGLITNDMDKLTPEKALYACLLTPQGKFLHDFFVIEGIEDEILIDCEGGERAQDLFERLNKYILRKNVKLHLNEHKDVFAIFGRSYGWPDPRHPEMGDRSFYVEERHTKDMPEKPFEEWDYRRITLTIPDGSRDLIPEKSTMDEARMDQLNAIDYDKGCYVGQELTARMHYRGLGKKHLQTVNLDDLPEKAELRSSSGNIGIALIKS